MHFPTLLHTLRIAPLKMKKRTSYDTTMKHLYRMGMEELIPISIRKDIPRTTIHRWRHEKKEKYVGSDLNKLAKSEMDLLKKFIHSRSERRLFMTYVRIGRFMQDVAGDKVMRKLLKAHKAELIDVIDRAKEIMPYEHVLRCFNISRSTYNVWVLGMYGDCQKSSLNWCKIRQPHQLEEQEVNTMRTLLTSQELEHWPISSVAHHARREGLMYASNATWYKYSSILSLRTRTTRFKARRKKLGIKASEPNQIWHADVTNFRVGTEMFYIYLVVDNYSRKILSHLVSNKLNAQNRLITIKEAYENEFGMLYPDMTLMVDGGSENNNATMDNFIDLLPNLRKLVALKDIQFGNIQIEAHNKILKQSWLYRADVKNGEQLKQITKDAIYEFNFVRPYDALGGMTPAEAHDNTDNYMNSKKINLMLETRRGRCNKNKCDSCENCPFKTEVLEINEKQNLKPFKFDSDY